MSKSTKKLTGGVPMVIVPAQRTPCCEVRASFPALGAPEFVGAAEEAVAELESLTAEMVVAEDEGEGEREEDLRTEEEARETLSEEEGEGEGGELPPPLMKEPIAPPNNPDPPVGDGVGEAEVTLDSALSEEDEARRAALGLTIPVL